MNYIYKCNKCGGHHIQVKAWIDIHDRKICDSEVDNDYWCEDCGKIVTVEEIQLNDEDYDKFIKEYMEED